MPTNKKRNKKITLIRKVEAVEKCTVTRNVEAAAREYDVQLSQLRKWRKNYPKIKELATKYPKKFTIDPGKKVENLDLEALVFG